jgi:predicted RNase H-like nuclease
MAVVGADGCRSGWFAVRHEDDGSVSFDVFGDVLELCSRWSDASLILLDIPIGLTDSPEQRECDAQARRALGPRRSSVFTPPCRAALGAGSYEKASEVNFRETGRKLNQQTWNISAKIREVDDLLRNSAEARSRVREVHPEVCFWGFAGGQPMRVRKKDRRGRTERLDLLSRLDARAPETYEAAVSCFLRREVARDDILDAMVAALTAHGSPEGLRTLPVRPQRDGRGLPMEMVYRTG